MAHIDNPDANFTHEQRREHFLKTLSMSLKRFNMTTAGAKAPDDAIAEYNALIDEKVKCKVEYMPPHGDSLLWIFAERYGRYLVYPYAIRRSIHLAFGFCNRPVGDESYSVIHRPKVSETFQLKATYSDVKGFGWYDSRVKKREFTPMRDEEIEFTRYISKLMFAGDAELAADYVAAMKLQLENI